MSVQGARRQDGAGNLASVEADGTGQRNSEPHSIAVVIPVYRGAKTLRDVVAELVALNPPTTSPDGNCLQVVEIVLVDDCGPDGSDAVIRSLADEFGIVRPVWLSRNFGQHPATLAGMASTGADWIVTMDEDGQHNPADIARMLDVGLREQASLVYASPTNAPPHGRARNIASAVTKFLAVNVLTKGELSRFHSFRLVLGEPGRGVAAYVGPNVYLDVALSWVANRVASCPVESRSEGDRTSGYTTSQLLSHFWSLVVSSGTRPLRLVSLVGVATAGIGFALAGFLVFARLFSQIKVQGWTSVVVAVLVIGGAILISLGVIAEYVGVAVRMAMGKPIYLIVSDRADGPLGRAGSPRGDDRR
jgi:glycosyltransferase involved in cell wall biosynthesis